MRAHRWRAALLGLLLPATAHADVEPPATPTVFLAIENRSGALKAAALKAAVRAALPGLGKGFSLSVVGGTPLEASPPLSAKDAKRVLAEVARAASMASTGAAAKLVLLRAQSAWTGAYGSTPRHHLVLLAATATSASDLSASLWMAVRRGFTVSVLSLARLSADELKALEEKGAGHAKVVTARTLGASLRAELAWSKLSKAEEQKLATARSSKLKILGALGKGSGSGGLIGVLRGSGGGSSGVLGRVTGGGGGVLVGGVGGLGLRGRSYGYGSSSRLRRGEALCGKRLALAFRQVACGGGCDVAEVRRTWIANAASLLACLEGAPSLGQDEVSVELGAAGKVVGFGDAARCATAWYAKQARRGTSARLIVGPVSAVR